MTQSTLSISNETFPQTRADINTALQANGSLQSGASAPGTTYAYQYWADTTNGVLKQRDSSNSSWQIRASLSVVMTPTKSASFNTVLGDVGKTFLISAASGAVTVSLLAAATCGAGFWMTFKRTDSTPANGITLDGNSSETIDGALTALLSNQYDEVTIQTDGSNWFIINDGRYSIAANGPLSGMRNKIINGDFRRWDYATTYALTTSVAYGSANRWAAGIFNQDTSITAGQGFKFDAKVGRTAASALTGAISLYQTLESVNSIPLAGKTVTLSYYAKAGANYSAASSLLNAVMNTGTGTDQSSVSMNAGTWTGQAQTSASDTLTTSWQRFQHTFTIPSSATQIGIQIFYTPVGTAGADDNFYITGVQLETGTVATPFEDRGDAIEAILCAHYAPIFGGVTGPIGSGAATSSSALGFYIPFQALARGSSTGLTVTTVGDLEVATFAGVDVAALTGLTFSKGSPAGVFVTATVSGTPLTSGTPYLLYAKTALTGNVVLTGNEL